MIKGTITSFLKEQEGTTPSEKSTLDTPVLKYVEKIIQKAIAIQASDIHFEPFENELQIRYRVDGKLSEIPSAPAELIQPIISRIKVMAELDIAERRAPQDGRIRKEYRGKWVDIRVSTLPTQYGESIVLRILDQDIVHLDLEKLGMPQEIYDSVSEVIQRPNGIFIVTGPTGSGKTTTLYSCLKKINTPEVKILSAEDPVEYELEGVQQVNVSEPAGRTFDRLLKFFLRQDPDCILIGETRDPETAQLAIQASLTGHRVFTSLHTYDTAGAITRLLDMGVEPYLLSTSLEAVLAQRLLRRICPACRRKWQPESYAWKKLGISPKKDTPLYLGEGCEQCNGLGHQGRVGIFELLMINEKLARLIHERESSLVIKKQAELMGMQTLKQHALIHLLEGTTTLEEVVKYTT